MPPVREFAYSAHETRRHGIVRRAARALAELPAAERDRWLLWLPVALGVGIGSYFALPFEPPAWIAWAGVAGAVLSGILWRRRPALLLLAIVLCTMALGFAAASLRTASVAEPVLTRRIGPVGIVGRVAQVELFPKATRITLERVEIEGLPSAWTPARVRIRLRGGGYDLRPGTQISVRAVLMPPPGPVAPGSYDFQRHLFFRGIGAVGYAVGPPDPISETAESRQDGGIAGWRVELAALRQDITERVIAGLPGAPGTVAAALMTGERKMIPEDVLAAFRDSGIAHLLAISGLHIGLIAGIIFFGTRALLALTGPWAVRLPVKKLAAVAALAGALAYLAISGASVPTQRAYLMLLIVMSGVLLDRIGLSMRLVAWAAIVVLLIAPESLLGASFQMSFGAVIALVAVYEGLGPLLAERRRASPPWMRPAFYLAAVALTTLVAGLATMPFAIYHFNQLAAFGLAANMGAVPLTALWIMPWAVLAFVLMPFGLESLALVPMGWGIEAVIWIARGVSSWQGAVILVPAMPVAGLVMLALGGLWLTLWRRGWRFAGLPLVAAGLATLWLTSQPDILVSGDGRLLAVRAVDGRLMLSSGRAGRFSADAWLRRAGQAERPLWPRAGSSADGRIACDGLGCIYRAGGKVVALSRDPRTLDEDCRLANVVISIEPVRVDCLGAGPGARVVIDRFDLWRRGSHALWLDADGVRVANARDVRGERPWVLKPERRPARRPIGGTSGASKRLRASAGD